MEKKNKKFPKAITSDAKQHLIMKDIAKGETYMDIVHKYMEEWSLSFKTVQAIVNDTIAFMRSQEAKDSLISMNMQRLDNIISDSMKDGDRKNAIKGIDVQNKLAGGYEDRITVSTDSEINFTFDIGE